MRCSNYQAAETEIKSKGQVGMDPCLIGACTVCAIFLVASICQFCINVMNTVFDSHIICENVELHVLQCKDSTQILVKLNVSKLTLFLLKDIHVHAIWVAAVNDVLW